MRNDEPYPTDDTGYGHEPPMITEITGEDEPTRKADIHTE